MIRMLLAESQAMMGAGLRLILELIAQGYSKTGIASRLGINGKTVDTHRVHLMDKLGLHRHVDRAQYVLQPGYVSVAWAAAHATRRAADTDVGERTRRSWYTQFSSRLTDPPWPSRG
jgi:Bacterial regulatory proteins, luxR family